MSNVQYLAIGNNNYVYIFTLSFVNFWESEICFSIRMWIECFQWDSSSPDNRDLVLVENRGVTGLVSGLSLGWTTTPLYFLMGFALTFASALICRNSSSSRSFSALSAASFCRAICCSCSFFHFSNSALSSHLRSVLSSISVTSTREKLLFGRVSTFLADWDQEFVDWKKGDTFFFSSYNSGTNTEVGSTFQAFKQSKSITNIPLNLLNMLPPAVSKLMYSVPTCQRFCGFLRDKWLFYQYFRRLSFKSGHFTLFLHLFANLLL